MKHIDEGWYESPEYKKARAHYVDSISVETGIPWDMVPLSGFPYSPQFRTARLAYRRRVNGSPSSETT